MRFIFAALGAMALAGCATPLMTEGECVAGAWRAAGFEDGASLRWADRYDERAALCVEAGAAPDANAYSDYMAGREAAFADLCAYRGGYDFGLSGGVYEGVCPAAREGDFLTGYFSGRRLHAAQARLEAAGRQHDNALNALDVVHSEIDRARATLADPDAKEKAIKRARRTLDSADHDLREARRRIDDADYDLDRAEDERRAAERSSYAWSDSPEFYALMDARLEAGAMARGADAISYCTDDQGFDRISCRLAPGAVLVSRDGVICAAGPGEARLMRRSPRYEGSAMAGYRHAYDVFPHDERGRPANRAAGFFEALFSLDGEFEGVACAPGDEQGP